MKKIIVSSLLLMLGIQIMSAQTFTVANKPEDAGMSASRLDKIDKAIQDAITKQQVPGMVAFVARNGKIVYYKAFGLSNTESKTVLKRDDIFRIASQSKAIASLAAMILWEEGKFQLDDAVSKYLPEFKNPKVLLKFNPADSTYTTQPAKGEITIRQLFTHTSGLDYAGIGTNEFKAIYAKAKVSSGIGNHQSTIGEKMRILGGLPLKHNPGEQYTYGLNLDVMGYLVEVLSGMPFDKFLKTRIFEPLGMNDTYFYLPTEKQNRLVALHQSKSGTYSPIKTKIFDGVDPNYPNLNGTYFSGGAGLNSTIEDYAKFLQLFINNGAVNGTHLISRKTVELILTNQIQSPINAQLGLGFGLETDGNDYKSVVSKGSFSWGGAFTTNYWGDPQEKIVALIYTNIYASDAGDVVSKFKTLVYSAIID